MMNERCVSVSFWEGDWHCVVRLRTSHSPPTHRTHKINKHAPTRSQHRVWRQTHLLNPHRTIVVYPSLTKLPIPLRGPQALYVCSKSDACCWGQSQVGDVGLQFFNRRSFLKPKAWPWSISSSPLSLHRVERSERLYILLKSGCVHTVWWRKPNKNILKSAQLTTLPHFGCGKQSTE